MAVIRKIVFFLLFVPLASFAQTVSNVTAEQVGKTIHVSYDLDKMADIKLFVSIDGGTNYKELNQVDGAVGKNIRPGLLTIVWNVLEEMGSIQSDNVLFKVRAGSDNDISSQDVQIQLPKVDFESKNPCLGTLTVRDFDGNIYHTVKIGNQCWMKENLRATHYSDGTEIALGTGKSDRKFYRYYPNGEKSNVNVLGYLYNWKAVIRTRSSHAETEIQGVCPIGWHVPSNAEWGKLIDYLSDNSFCLCNGNKRNLAKAIAATSGWKNNDVECSVGFAQYNNNASGFFALPAGDYFGQYEDFGTYANFWSSTEEDELNAWSFSLNYSSARVNRNSYYKSYGFSVRCLKNE